MVVEAKKMSKCRGCRLSQALASSRILGKENRTEEPFPVAVCMSTPPASGVRVIVQVHSSFQWVGCVGMVARKSHHWILGTATPDTRAENNMMI